LAGLIALWVGKMAVPLQFEVYLDRAGLDKGRGVFK